MIHSCMIVAFLNNISLSLYDININKYQVIRLLLDVRSEHSVFNPPVYIKLLFINIEAFYGLVLKEAYCSNLFYNFDYLLSSDIILSKDRGFCYYIESTFFMCSFNNLY